MNELHLFAGAGGGILGGMLLGHKTVCAVEIEPYCRKVLLQRQRDGILPWFPIWDDVRTFDGKPWRGIADVVCGGFPCQPFSTAGKQKGEEDSRNLWPETIRIICEVRPRFAFLENVPALLSFKYIQRIFGDLAEAGFNARWCVLGADDCGFMHRRKRLWILAYPKHDGQVTSEITRVVREGSHTEQDWEITASEFERFSSRDGREKVLAVASSNRPQRELLENISYSSRTFETFYSRKLWQFKEQLPQPYAIGSSNGVASRMDRTKAIGNGQVPIVAKTAWEILSS